MWKESLLTLYYYADWPRRQRANRAAAAAGRAPAMVLFYHRVAEDRANSWTCGFDMFARQMRWLKARFEMVSLAEVQARLRAGKNFRPCVGITFDDGYAENCDRALPLLVRENIPCTYFVTVRNVLEGVPFSHDVACKHAAPPNTLAQLREMAAAGIEIGAHTRVHANLGAVCDADRLHDEIVVARDDLAAALGRPVRYFAFPYGLHANLSSRAFEIAREAGYAGVCSAYGGYNFPGDDAFHLQRIHGGDDMIRLKNWTTVDRRKLATPRFVYANANARPDPAMAGAACP